MGRFTRLMQNLFAGWWQLPRRFPASLLDAVTAAIASGEQQHRGEVCFAVQSRLPWLDVLAGVDARRHAEAVFARLRVWDTEHNNGVLVYVLLAERRIEIIADRGIDAQVEPAEWRAICARMRERYAAGAWREGTLQGIADVNALLARHFPADGTPHRNELGDQPIIL
jgi:uncharacterized membrane protein